METINRAGQKISKNINKLRDVAALDVTGHSYPEIAHEMNCSVRTVYRLMSREEVKRLIEEQSQEIIKLIPRAVQNCIELVNGFNPKMDRDTKKLAWEATKKVLEAPGIFTGNSSVRIDNLLINQQNNLISPKVLELLKRSSVVEGEVIDEITCNAGNIETKETGVDSSAPEDKVIETTNITEGE